VELLETADRPFIFSGGGVVLGNAAPELREVLALLDAPCTSSLMGLGAIPGDDPRFLGMPGMHGTYEANLAMQHCDVLLAIGVRFDDRVIGNTAHFACKSRKIIHIDIDPSSISKRVKVDVPIVGDARTVLRQLAAVLRARDHRSDAFAMTAWWDQIRAWQARRCLAYTQEPGVIKPQAVLQALSDLTSGMDAYVTSDVGQHQMWAAQYIRFHEPRRWINSGGLGTMGVGLPYAMGIKLARPQSEVFCVTGEGSIQMCIQELSTCRQYRTPIKIVSLNNGYLGMVRQQQEIGYGSRYSHSYMEALPDFVRLAEAYGHVGIRVDRPEDVEPALREAVRLTDRTVFLDIRTDPGANVWPTVVAGRGLTEMLLGSEDL
jgi:acetolactate synthase I/II/III large subunit